MEENLRFRGVGTSKTQSWGSSFDFWRSTPPPIGDHPEGRIPSFWHWSKIPFSNTSLFNNEISTWWVFKGNIVCNKSNWEVEKLETPMAFKLPGTFWKLQGTFWKLVWSLLDTSSRALHRDLSSTSCNALQSTLTLSRLSSTTFSGLNRCLLS